MIAASIRVEEAYFTWIVISDSEILISKHSGGIYQISHNTAKKGRKRKTKQKKKTKQTPQKSTRTQEKGSRLSP